MRLGHGLMSDDDAKVKGKDSHKGQAKVMPTSGNNAKGKGGTGGLGLGLKPWEIVVAVLVMGFGFCVFQKQGADAKVAQCAQQHERGDYEAALNLCLEALLQYHQLNELSKVVWSDGLLWGDVAQTTVRDSGTNLI